MYMCEKILAQTLDVYREPLYIQIMNQKLSGAIKALTQKWQVEEKIKTAYDVGCGLCEDFFYELIGDMPEAMAYYLEIGGFDDGEDGEYLWDVCPERFSDDPNPPKMAFECGTHILFYCDGLYYDAECPEGVMNIVDVPLVKSWYAEALEDMGETRPS